MNVSVGSKIVLKNIVIADSFWTKLCGYMFRRSPHVPGILFVTNGSMQTTFMNFNLDIIFLDANNKIIKILRNVKPWRFTKFYSGTKKVLEVPEGNISQIISEGDILNFTQ